ncbi:MAG TPA: DUF222 domain-containing protein, partial [Pseudonocardiaceae bacterium]|nr:DUF222 domain-containing protein [Pseudonocardiaceae bacterium]
MTTTTPAALLRDALDAFTSPASLGRDQLLDALTALGDVQAVLDAVKLRVAAELVARSVLIGSENPVHQAGHASPAVLVAERWQIPVPAARQYCLVGDATAPRVNLTGEVLPPRFPALAEAVSAPVGWVSVEQAAVIVRELGKAAPGCTAADLEVGERVLVQHAPTLTVTELRSLAGQVRDRLDQDGIVPRELRQQQRRSLTISTTSDGMTHLDWYLNPESAGYVLTAIDAMVGSELRQVRFRDPAEPATTGHETDDADLPETRTMAQIRSDAATDVFRHLATCTGDTGAGGKPPVTVLVRIDLHTLQTGVGVGQIDGIPTPVSAGTVRRMAADAHLIPMVLGTDSEVLDLGRKHRLFNRAQKLALAERDGGCAWTGCPHPPSYTEAHHIRWWDSDHGATD